MNDADKEEYRQLRDAVYTYFYYLNKPVVLTEIVLQFKNYKKPQLLKVLDDLVEKQKIFSKTPVKSKVYCLSQTMSYEVDESIYTDEIDKMQNQEIEDRTLRYLKWNYTRHLSELNKLKEESTELERRLSALDNEMTIDELKRAIDDMEAAVKEHRREKKQEVVSNVDFNKVKKEYASVKKEQARRSRIVKDILSSLSEATGLSVKALQQEAGIDEQ